MDQIDFDFSAVTKEYLTEKKAYIINEITKIYDSVAKLTVKRTFVNTVQALINVDDHVKPLVNCIEYVHNFYPNEELRQHAMELYKELEQFSIDTSMRKDVHNAFLKYQENNFCHEKATLHEEEVRYFEHAMRDFKRMGLHINDSSIKDMKKKLAKLETEFSDNINKENTWFTFNRMDLDGMPLTWFENNKPIKTENGQDFFKVTLKYPDYLPLMEYCTSRTVRKKMYVAYQSRCYDTNIDIFAKIIALRSRLARLLGYTNHADYKTEIQLVKNSYTAIKFETEMNRLFTPLYEKEKMELLKFAIEHGFTFTELEPWDTTFYIRMYKEVMCYVDMQEVRSYFPLDTVKNGMFKIYEGLLGLKFIKVPNSKGWYDTLEYYEVLDKESNQVMGYFYLDLYPRTGKYAHAAIFPLQYGFDTSNNPYFNSSRSLPVACMVCNFPQNEPLSHNDVETFFHEFGHVMHVLCSQTSLAKFSSFNVEGDFVEAPSQMLEYWCLNEDALKIMSGNKDTHEPIPEALIEKLRLMSKLMQGHHNKRQLLLGSVDLWYHTLHVNDYTEVNVVKMYNEACKSIMGVNNVPGTCMIASFGHLVGGYDAGYYGYLRSETYAANMYYGKFKGHELDPVVGMQYRKHILEPGASQDGMDLVENFLGEKTDDKYFLIDKGLSQEDLSVAKNSVK